MDRSFLSKPEVIEASRRFVCIRLATYEHREEAELLKSIFIGRSGDLENSTFAILSPDGKRKLTRAGRSPSFAFFGSEQVAALEMASTMQRIADQYEAKATTPAAKLPLPLIENTRLALNIAACDSQALVVAFSSDDDRRRQLQERLRPLAWSDDFIGQFLYVSENRRAALKAVEGLQVKEGVVIVSPGLFGQSGRVLAQVPFDHEPKQLANALSYSAFAHQKTAKDTRSHTSRGRREGVDWKTLLPVTDPGRPPGRRR